MKFIVILLAYSTSFLSYADCVFCQGNGVSISSETPAYKPLTQAQLMGICAIYEEGNNLQLIDSTIVSGGNPISLDDYYAQYDKISCHNSRMTPIYRFVMQNGNMYQPQLQRELEYFKNMDEKQRFEILNRVHVWRRSDGTERGRITLLDQVYLFGAKHVEHQSSQAEGFEALKKTLEELGAKRHRDMTEDEKSRAPLNIRLEAGL